MTSHDLPSFLDESGHVPANEMARYMDGVSDRATRSRLAHHLADCEECREELTALRRLVPPRSRMSIRVGAVLSAAAAVMLITMSWRGTLTSRFDGRVPDGTRAPAGLAEIDAPLPVVSPVSDALVASDSVQLIWHVAGTDAAYTVMILDESGGVLFSRATNDTSLLVPATTVQQRKAGGVQGGARTYYWSVQARLLDGRSAKTGVHRFRVP